MSELADRGKPERAAYYLKKKIPHLHAHSNYQPCGVLSKMCGQWPRCWCASSAVLGTGRSPLGELDEWSLELAGQRRALSRQTRWSTQVRFWLTVWIFTVKVRWPQLRSLIAVLDGLLSPGGGFLVFLWIGGDGVGHGCLGRGGGSSGRGPELKAGPSRRASHCWVTGETERAAARARGTAGRREGQGVGEIQWALPLEYANNDEPS